MSRSRHSDPSRVPSGEACIVEPMRIEHIPEVLAIEVTSFSLPWTEEMFANELARGTLSEVLVARAAGSERGPVIGYVCAWVVTDELHVNNLAVHPRWRRRGVARALLEDLLDRGRARGARAAYLEVRASNGAAQALYRRLGFRAVGARPRYYTHPVEDAVIMARTEG